MFLNVVPDVEDRLFRACIVKQMRLEEKPFQPDKREVIVLKNKVLHVEEGPGPPPFRNPMFHLLINGCARVRGEDAELSDIGIELLGKTDRFMNRLRGVLEPAQDVGSMNLEAMAFQQGYGLSGTVRHRFLSGANQGPFDWRIRRR